MITVSLNVLLLTNLDLCFPQNCFYVCVGSVPCVSMCLENGLLSFSGPWEHNIDFWQLSEAITLSESQNIIMTVSPKSQTPSLFLTPHPLSLRSHSPSSSSSYLSLCFARSGLPVALRRVSDLWPDKWNLKLPSREGAGSAAHHHVVPLPLSSIVWVVFFFFIYV